MSDFIQVQPCNSNPEPETTNDTKFQDPAVDEAVESQKVDEKEKRAAGYAWKPGCVTCASAKRVCLQLLPANDECAACSKNGYLCIPSQDNEALVPVADLKSPRRGAQSVPKSVGNQSDGVPNTTFGDLQARLKKVERCLVKLTGGNRTRVQDLQVQMDRVSKGVAILLQAQGLQQAAVEVYPDIGEPPTDETVNQQRSLLDQEPTSRATSPFWAWSRLMPAKKRKAEQHSEEPKGKRRK